MSTTRAKQITARCPNIPTLPIIVQRVGELLRDPAVGTREIGKVVSEDPPLAARVLKIANSAYYGLRERCLSSEQACTVLGLKVLKNVVTAAAVMRQFEHLEGAGIDLEAMWKHSVLVGQSASLLAKRARATLGLTADEFYTCGLLHDVGKLVLLENLGAEYVAVLQRSQLETLPVQVCEDETLGFDHSDVGAMLAVQWGLPSALAAAIQYHHGPREAVERDPIVALVANANLLVKRVQAGNLSAAASTFDAQTAGFLSLSPSDITPVVEFVAEQAVAVAA